ncbi:Glycine--tRNA ligase beta subunit [Azospirillaceae bacterium]
MAELLVELFSEDIPARMQARAAEDLRRLITDGLTAAGLTFSRAEGHSTPRRLALVVDGVPERSPDVREEKRGPRVGAPEGAIQGFLKSVGLTDVRQCEQRDSGKGVFWFAVVEKPGRAAAEVLPGIIQQAILDMPWPKSMRWSDNSQRWVRPLHSILALFGGKALDGAFNLGGPEAPPRQDSDANLCLAAEAPANMLRFGARTRGHRFLAPDAFEVSNFVDYKEKLRSACVILDRDERKAKIKADAEALATREGLSISPDDGLLEEVAGLVEWPVVLMGAIDEQFMSIPPEVLTTSMRTHQKYFATLQSNGALASRFIVVANTTTADGGAAVVAGNQRVLRARLSDAKFFWDQDRKEALHRNLTPLRDVTFHARLGTVFDKVARLEELATAIAAHVPGADRVMASHAAILSKTDLVTGMVGELPELQGVMGRYYALAAGERREVADALAEHYKPLGPNDRCPTASLSVALALADKIDTLVGFFAIDEKPTGSKDPYALRRAALGVIRLILENSLRVRLGGLLLEAHALYRVNDLAPAETVARQLLDFTADRLKVVLKDRGVRHDLIDAVFALGGEDDLVRVLARVSALQGFLGSDDGANLLTAYRRASNIVRIEEKKDGRSYDDLPDAALFAQPEETALGVALSMVAAEATPLLAAENFAGCMAALAQLRRPLDAFFDRVTVNADRAELRVNRLYLLAQIRTILNAVADFSRIEG